MSGLPGQDLRSSGQCPVWRNPGARYADGAVMTSEYAAFIRRNGKMGQDAGLSAELPTLLPRLWRFALRLAGDRNDAEDLVQRACARALEHRHQLQPGTVTLSWLFSIVHSLWRNEVRARQIRSHGSLQWSEELADTVADPRTHALHQQVIAAVEKLPDAQRAVMLLIAVEGLSYREAAEVLEVPIGTVMSCLARARLTIGESFRVLSDHIEIGRVPNSTARSTA